jgi:cobalamin biosynthesis Mg chelatase CobN
MSNPLEREQQPQKTIDLINNSSNEAHVEAEEDNRVTQPSAKEEAKERFFKQFDAQKEHNEPAEEDVRLEEAPFEEEATIDLTESLKQASAKAEQASPQEPKKSEAGQSRAERRKKVKEDQLIEKKPSEEAENVTSREAMRKKEQEATKKLRVRVFPVWLRLIVILVLCVIALVGGAMIGYGIIGKGNPLDIFDIKTWTHIRDIIYLKK